MPVTGYQVLMRWTVGNQGVSDTYYWNTVSDDPVNVVYPAAYNLMKYRHALMGFGVQPLSFRISQVNNFRAYLNSKPEDVRNMQAPPTIVAINTSAPGLPPGVPNTADGSADEANVCVICTAYSTIQNHARKFLAGCPDVMVRTDPLGPFVVGVPSWKSLFDQYANQLYSQPKWTFKARIPAAAAGAFAPVAVQNWQQDPTGNGNWDILVSAAAGPPFNIGGTIQLRGFKMNSRAYVSFNGVYTIGSVTNGPVGGTVWLQLLNSKAVAGAQVAIPGNARAVDYQLYPYTSIIPTGQGSHKRGNSGLASRGKRRVVQRVSA